LSTSQLLQDSVGKSLVEEYRKEKREEEEKEEEEMKEIGSDVV
jgi:hypothetical protein